MLPKGMTIEDAMLDYQNNKAVIAANDGILRFGGFECIDCYEPHPVAEMRYCGCDESLVCSKCCEHCGFNEEGECTW